MFDVAAQFKKMGATSSWHCGQPPQRLQWNDDSLLNVDGGLPHNQRIHPSPRESVGQWNPFRSDRVIRVVIRIEFLIANAIKRAGTTEGKALRIALAETKGYKAVTGEITYSRPSGVPMKGVSIISVHNGQYKVEEVWFPKP